MRRGPISPIVYLLPTAAFLVVLPLILHGCSCGHDFDFHLVSWMEAASQFEHGNLHTSWAYSPAWNAGEPRFVFYPPISWTLGAALGLILPWNAVPIVYTWLALLAAGLGMYSLARTLHANESSSTLASIIYIANPYILFTAYERTAYAELLAAAWIPLLFSAILRDRITPLRIAIPIALLWLTNAPAAVMGSYALALLAAFRVLQECLKHRNTARACALLAVRITSGLLLGLGSAAFYILPAAYERRWVQIAMATVKGMRIQDNFLFHHTSDALHDAVLHTASWIAVTILLASLALLAVVLMRPSPASASPDTRHRALTLIILSLVIGALLTPASALIWRIAPEMTFLQFPWRLNAILATVLGAAIAMLLSQTKLRHPLLIACSTVILAGLIWPSYSAFVQACDDEDTVAARRAVFNHQMGTDPTDEYTPGDADNDALAHTNPPFWLTEDGNAPAPANGEQPGPAPAHFAIQRNRASVLVLNLRQFPAWRIHLNGKEIDDRIDRADGLIALPVPAGKSQVEISYARTTDRTLGDALSFIAVCIAIATTVRRRRVSVRLIH